MQILNNILLYDSTTLLACNNKEDLIDTLKDYEIKFKCIDYDEFCLTYYMIRGW